MTTLDYLHRYTIPASFALLPEMMKSPQAAAMLLAIALQESNASARQQFNGPARGFWQFEVSGVRGVCTHPATRPHLEPVLHTLCYRFDWSTSQRSTQTVRALQSAITDNDVLACVFSRLNLWWLPNPLPASDDPNEGWRQYVGAWAPGKPHRENWNANFARAWALVNTR